LELREDFLAGIDLNRLNGALDSHDSVDDLRRYFGVGHPQDVPAFTGGWFERVGGGGDRPGVANEVTADDLVAVETLSVQVPPRVALDLLHGRLGGQLTELLAQIPTGLPLAATEAVEHIATGSPADRAWELLVAQPGVKWVTASKVLARKRPQLLPVYDNVVRCALKSPENFWTALHEALSADGGALDARLSRLLVAAGVENVSTIRALDVALWMRHHAEHTDTGCPGLS
jgi:hypothetical protein